MANYYRCFQQRRLSSSILGYISTRPGPNEPTSVSQVKAQATMPIWRWRITYHRTQQHGHSLSMHVTCHRLIELMHTEQLQKHQHKSTSHLLVYRYIPTEN